MPVFHIKPVPPVAVSWVDCPVHTESGLAVMTITGKGFTFIEILAVPVHPAVVPVTV